VYGACEQAFLPALQILQTHLRLRMRPLHPSSLRVVRRRFGFGASSFSTGTG
jgi:hypothetical protein